jgi:hypothetical protein
MRRFRHHDVSAEVLRELEAIDATLSGARVPSEDAALAELVRELQSSRPQPRPEFVRNLDAKVGRGFAKDAAERPTRRSWRPANGAGLTHFGRPPRPALGLVLALAAAAAVAVPLATSGGHRGQGAAQPIAASHSSRTTPAVAGPPSREAERSTKGGDRAPATNGSPPAAPQASDAAGANQRRVERTTSLDVGVAPSSIESASKQVFTLVSGFNGYVRQSTVSSGGSAQGGASFDLRIPSYNLTGAIAALAHLGHLRSENDTTNDVTEQFNSLQRSLGDREAERAGLLKQIAGVSEPQQAASLKALLQSVERQISQLHGALGALRARVDYTSLALTLTTETPVASKQGDLTPGGAARDAAQILQAALAVVVIGVAALVPLGVLALAAWILSTATRRRLREDALDAS